MRKHLGFVALMRGVAVAVVTLVAATVAHADLGFWSQALVGTWRHSSNGDVYRFNSNATYTFTAGAVKARGRQLSHSGYWKIVQPTESESGGSMEGPVALVLKSRSRIERRNGRSITLHASRNFRVLVDVVHSDGDHEIDRNLYLIGFAKWKRVR